ncbi:YcxB family protein [Ruficoccus amylovorans]|uniref:YcxB family protein n=1 Tax=Ruficoccus amylovorans TaxID=1804625 RepID=A0A842HJL0_9BACT|nr:YcxB family protein [Ruficoccus amylovorans]MBC2595824.1 YcxB family protein [Ruficoccus amylovorans]
MIELEYTYDRAYVIALNRVLARRYNRFTVPAYWFFLVLVAVGVVFVTVMNLRNGTEFDSGYFVLVGILAWWVAVPWLVRMRIVANFKKSPAAGGTVKWAIDESALWNGVGNSEGRLSWQDLYRVEDVRAGFLIYTQPRYAVLLPAESFVTEADRETLRGYARAAGKLK